VNKRPATFSDMPTLVIPAAIKIEILGTIAGRQCANVMGGLNTGGAGATQTQLLAMADVIQTTWRSTFLPLFSDAYTYRETRLTSLNTATSPQVTVTNPGNGTKQNAGSPQIAQLIKLLTAVRSRSGRGRVYLPPPGDGDVNSSGVLLPQQVTDLTSAFTTLRTNMLNAGLEHAVLSRTKSVATVVTGFVVDPKVATQRRRLRG
jgi:hypothetical protein